MKAQEVYNRQCDTFAQRYHWRRSRAQRCPRVVGGKHCKAWRDSIRPCLCQQYRQLFDHGLIWLNQAGYHVLTGEPYAYSVADLDAFRADPEVQALGLTIERSADESPYYPGYSILIIVRRAAPASAFENCTLPFAVPC